MADEGLGTDFVAGGGAPQPWDYAGWLQRLYAGQPSAPGVPPLQQQPQPLAGPSHDPMTGTPMTPEPQAQGKFNRIADTLAGAMRDFIATPGRMATGKYQVTPADPTKIAEEEAFRENNAVDVANTWGPGTALNMFGISRLPGGAPPGAFGAAGGGRPLKRAQASAATSPATSPATTGGVLANAVEAPRTMTPEELQRGRSMQGGSEMPQRAIIQPGDMRVSTRFPTGVKATENPLTHHLSIGTEEMRASPGFSHNVSLLSEYPGFGRLKGMDDEAAVQAYLKQAQDNMQYLYDRSPPEMKKRSPLWYEGANEISGALARRWGVPRPSASGALAALSPQMDWFKNASLGERVGDIMTGAQAGKKLTPEMAAFGQSASFLQKPEMKELFRSVIGKTLDEVDGPLQQALWVRLYDEAHNPRAYRSVTPEGNFGDFIRNQDGSPAKIAWGALGEIDKAVRSLQSGGDPSIISPILGNKHKVRSFYNNIEVPNDTRFGDITADTHQVAAAQMRPLSGKSPAVAHSLAGSLAVKDQPPGHRAEKSSSVTGVQGTYGLTADAARQMALENEMLPREAQSATWEPVRELFSPKFKANRKNTEGVDAIWHEYDRGTIRLEQARDKIFDFAGGIGTPGWARPGARVSAPAKSSTYR